MSTQVTILGNTGGEVELHYMPNGTPVANFSVASNTFRNTPAGQQKKTDWYRISAFGKTAETLAKYLDKGSQILVRGRLSLSAWKTNKGELRVNADVVLQDFEFAGSKPAKPVHEPADNAISEEEMSQAISSSEPAEDAEEQAEMLAAIQEMDTSDEAFAGQY